MGHYDDSYERTEREQEERAKREATLEAKRLKLPLLGATDFEPLGVCVSCANVVRCIPNWKCTRNVCPHKPS